MPTFYTKFKVVELISFLTNCSFLRDVTGKNITKKVLQKTLNYPKKIRNVLKLLDKMLLNLPSRIRTNYSTFNKKKLTKQ